MVLATNYDCENGQSIINRIEIKIIIIAFCDSGRVLEALLTAPSLQNAVAVCCSPIAFYHIN